MFSLNSAQFSDRNICHYSKRAWTCHLLHKGDQDATTTSARRLWERGSLNGAQFMLQWFVQFPEFAEFTEFPFNLGKTLFFVTIHLTFQIIFMTTNILWDRWHFEWHFKWHFILHFITRHDISYNNLWCYMHNMTFHGKPFPNISYQVVCFCAMNFNINNFI